MKKGLIIMKRIALILICEKEKKNTDYLLTLKNALENEDIEVVFLSGNEGTVIPESLKNDEKNFGNRIGKAVQYARKQKAREIIFLTDSFMGPVYPLNEFIEKLNKCSTSGWRLTRDSQMYGLKQDLWKQLEACNCQEDVAKVCQEANLLELYDTSDIAHLSIKPMITEPLRIICEKRCPFFLHEVFHMKYEKVIQYSLGYQAPAFYKWLCDCKDWDVNLLWNYMLPSYHQDDYYWNLHLRYVLPTDSSDKQWVSRHLKKHKVALVMHLHYPDKFNESLSFAKRFPKETHMIITTNSEEKKQKLTELLLEEAFSSYEIRLIKNRGRDVSALLIGIADIYHQFDYICRFHDKKTLQTKPGTIGEGFAYKLEENLFPTNDYINRVIKLFDDNPRLGMLSPPAPHHAAYFHTLATDWGPNYKNTEAIVKELEYQAPISPDHMPIAPLGTCFWFRADALKVLFDYGWNYLDFPPEPLSEDGTILHAIERVYPFACVESGYYPAYVMSDRYAKIEYTNMRYYVEGYNRVCVNHNIMNTHKVMKDQLISRLNTQSK